MCTDGLEDYPVVGFVGEVEAPYQWTATGEYCPRKYLKPYFLDLIEEPSYVYKNLYQGSLTVGWCPVFQIPAASSNYYCTIRAVEHSDGSLTDFEVVENPHCKSA